MIVKEAVERKYFSFAGYVSYHHMPAIYNRADIYVNSSLCENMSATVLEAMSCGIPVIATNIYGVNEVIRSGENGMLVPPCDEVSLAKSIITLLENENLRNNIGSLARQTILNRFEWNIKAQEILNVYQRTTMK
jgi:glycosyltransferase involved in cell wall biosynthesis